MELLLTGKRALITGSTSGIGEACAKLLAKEGVTVTVQGRDQERGHRVLQEITDQGGQAFLSLGDLRDDEQAKRVAQEAVSAMGGVDILINSAGVFAPLKFLSIPPQQWLDLYNNNVVSYVRLAQQLAPAMVQQQWGRIINISSRGGSMSRNVAAHYAATKAANLSITLSLADALKQTGVTVNAVSPGEVDTPGAQRFFAQALNIPLEEFTWQEVEQQSLQKNPNLVGRYGQVKDIAVFVALLASPLSEWTSGQNFHLDGGSTHNLY